MSVGMEVEGVGEDVDLLPLILRVYDGVSLASVQVEQKEKEPQSGE